MKNVNEFVEKLVSIDFVVSSNCYGHYPFQLFIETKDGSFELNALLLGGDVASCYARVSKYIKDNAKRIYLSLDFPEILDSKHDFIAIFSIEDKKTDLFAIPYDPKTGTRFEIMKQGVFLDKILIDFKNRTGA